MAIIKYEDPSALPASIDDYVDQNNHLNLFALNITTPFPIDFSAGNVLKGSIFNIGGDLFYTNADTAITGTASEYVKLTPGATSATAAYVTAATVTADVSWNQAYNGYYDTSGNLYIFDEIAAIGDGVISTAYSQIGFLLQELKSAMQSYNNIGKVIYTGTASTEADLWAAVAPSIPNVDDICMVSGGQTYDVISSPNKETNIRIFSHAKRLSSTQITFYSLQHWTAFSQSSGLWLTSVGSKGFLDSWTITNTATALPGSTSIAIGPRINL